MVNPFWGHGYCQWVLKKNTSCLSRLNIGRYFELKNNHFITPKERAKAIKSRNL